MIIPYSTDVHDGSIRLAAIEIIGICLLVHIFVSIDERRVQQEMFAVNNSWQNERTEGLYRSFSDTGYAGDAFDNLEKTVDDYANRRASESFKDLESRIREVQKSGLMYKLGLVLSNFRPHAVLTHMFTHGGWLHLIGNMIFFYVCGVAMEQFWGYWRFLLIYLGCGIAAVASFAGVSLLTSTFSSGVPLVGASGAIAGVMGAFLVTHTKVNIRLFWWFGFRWGSFKTPAYVYLGFWFISQIFFALLSLHQSSGVAYTAHIGGFIAGWLLGFIIKSEDVASIVNPVLARQRNMKAAAGNTIPEGVYYTPRREETVTELAQRDDPEALAEADVETAGWEAFNHGNGRAATLLLSRAMNNYLLSPEQCRPHYLELLGKIIKNRSALHLQQNEYYQWAKQLDTLKEHRHAVICFDMAAFLDGSAHIRNNSLLEASRLLMQSGSQPDKVKRDMEYLLSVDPDGIAGNRAREVLGKFAGGLQ